MNKMELTRAVEILNGQLTLINGQVSDSSNRLHVAVPGMNSKIQTSADGLTSMFNAISSEIQPVIDQFSALQNNVVAMNTEANNQYAKRQVLGENVNSRFNELKQILGDKTAAFDASIESLGCAVPA